MSRNIFSRIATIINRIVDVIASGSLERPRVLNELNKGFKEAYLNGDLENLCRVTTGMGVSRFMHRLRSPTIISGFKVTIENERQLTDGEIKEYGKVIVDKKRFIRDLMSMGYDTLLLIPKNNLNGIKGLQKSFKSIVDLDNYMID